MNPSDRFQSVSDLKQLFQNIDNPIPSDVAGPFSLKTLIPPGFRTLTPWKIAVSSIIYLSIFSFCLTLEFKVTNNFALWFERIVCLLIMLSIVFCSFNYCNVQRIFPLCRHQNRMIHYIGVVLLDIIVAIYFLFVMVLIESTLFS